MTGRWWDPGSDVALLTATGDAKVDLANAFTALHRAGASAIADTVATHPVVDDAVLLQALATARSAFAPMLLEPVAKATTGDRRYAGVLLRDVYDEAEIAALQLYRRAVAKGLPRRAAADRVAKVFGVPAHSLGRYATLATETTTSPQVLTDLADETLFAAIGDLVAEETSHGTPVAIAKDDQRHVAEYNTTAEGKKHPKDQHGLFTDRFDVNELVARSEAQLTAEETIDRATRTEPARAPRKVRRTRTVRRLTRDRTSAATTSRARADRARNTRARAERPVTSRERVLRELADATNRDFEVISSPVGRARNTPGDYLKVVPGAPVTTPLHEDVGWVLPLEEFTAFMRDAPRTVDGGRIMRAHALVEYAGSPMREYPVAEGQQSVLEESTDGLIAAHQKTPKMQGAEPPHHRTLSVTAANSIIHAANPETRRLALEEAKKDLVREWIVDNDLDSAAFPLDREIGYVELYGDYHNTDGWVLVYTPPPQFGSTSHRPMTVVAEILAHGGIRGTHEMASRHGAETFTLDGNQPIAIYQPRGENGRPAPFEQAYDTEKKVLRVLAWTREATEEDVDRSVSKAFTPEQFRQVEAEGRIHRDQTGEFTSMSDYIRSLGYRVDDDAEPAATPARQVRRARRVRRGAPATPDRTRTDRERTARPTAAHARAVRARGQRQLTAAETPRSPGWDYQPFDDYTVLTDIEMHRRFGVHEFGLHEPKPGEAYTLHREHVDWLLQRGPTPKAESKILLQGQEDLYRLEQRSGAKMLEPMTISTDDDWTRLERRLVELSYDDGLEGIIVSFHRSLRTGAPVVHVKFAAAHTVLPAANAIRWESGNGDDRRMLLTYEGETTGMSRATLHNLVDGWKEYDEKTGGGWRGNMDYVVNPRVRLWRVESAD